MGLVFFHPRKDSAIAKAGRDLFLQSLGIDAGELQEILVERTIIRVFAVFAVKSGTAFIENSGQDDISPQANSWTPGGMNG